MTLKKFSLWLGGVFSFVVVALTILITVSFQNKQPIMDEMYFVRGVHYQAILEKEKKAEKNGWQLSVEKISNAGGYNLQVNLSNLGECTVPEVTLTLERRASAQHRRRWQLDSPVKNGPNLSFKLAENIMASGEWEVSAVAESKECRKILQEFIVL